MKNMIVSLLVVLLWSSHAMTQGQDHPGLFFKADEAADVKQRALTPGTTAHKLWLETFCRLRGYAGWEGDQSLVLPAPWLA